LVGASVIFRNVHRTARIARDTYTVYRADAGDFSHRNALANPVISAGMKPSIRAWPFESRFLLDYAVVEERHSYLRRFPATEQLPTLSKAINKEFEAGLTTRLATTNGRADHWRKLHLKDAVWTFCQVLNNARPDHLQVVPYYTPELVAQIALVQRITESGPGGLLHRFRFFRNDDYLPDVYLSGSRPVWTTHCFDRYGERSAWVKNYAMNQMLADMLHTVMIPVLINGQSLALAFSVANTVAAVPFEIDEQTDDIRLLTTLSPDGRSTMEPTDALPPLNWHYGPEYKMPEPFTFAHAAHRQELLKKWNEQTPQVTPHDIENLKRRSWVSMVQAIPHLMPDRGYTPQTRVNFIDGIHGPSVGTREESGL